MAAETTQQAPKSRRAPALGDDPAGRRRRLARWIARGLLALAIPVAVIHQGGAPHRAVVALAVALALVWLPSTLALPHRRPNVLGAWALLALGAWTALQTVSLPRGLVRVLNPLTVEVWDRSRAALGLAPLDYLPIATAPGDAALQAVVYLLAGVAGSLASLLLMGSQGRLWLRWAVWSLLGSAVVTGLAYLTDEYLVAEGLLPTSAHAILQNVRLVNGNHVAAVANLGLALALGNSLHARQLVEEIGYGLCALFLAGVTLASGSRGGILIGVATLLGTILATPTAPKYMRVDPRDRAATARMRAALLGAIVLLVAVTAAMPILEQEFGTTDLNTDPKVDSFRRIFGALTSTPLVGYAPGTLPVLLGRSFDVRARQDFAENLILDRVTATGPILGTLFLVVLAVVTARGLIRVTKSVEGKTFAVAWVGFLAANLVDFSFELAGPLVMAAIVAAAFGFCGEVEPDHELRLQRGVRKYHLSVIAATGLALAVVGLLIRQRTADRLTRDVPAQVAPLSTSAATTLVGERFGYDEHALYLVGRKLVDDGKLAAAAKVLDGAAALRPSSAHVRLFRFAARLETGDVKGATIDLMWLLTTNMDVAEQALQVCIKSSKAEALLIEVLPKLPERSYELAARFQGQRPDLVERVAVELRRRYPGKIFGIEVLRAELYIRRGAMAPAKAIAAALMADERTQFDGWRVQGTILQSEHKNYEAYHVFRWLCEKNLSNEYCVTAIRNALESNRPAQSLDFIRAQAGRFRATPSAAAIWWRFQGQAQIQLGDWAEALEALRNAHGLDPDDLEASLLLATALEHESLFGELAELVASLSETHGQNPHVIQLVAHAAQVGQVMPLPAPATPTAPRAIGAARLPAAVTKTRP